MSGIDDSPNFLRQRRNLILASLALVFAQGTHLTIKQFNFSGLTGSIDAPISTIPYLWILCLYFLWRYWQAFVAEKTVSTKDRLKASRKKVIERFAVREALKPYLGTMPPLSTIGKHELKAWMPHDEEELTSDGSANVVIVTNMVGDPITGQKNITVVLKKSKLRVLRIKALFHLVFTTNEFSEYYLPFTIVALPAAIWIWQRFC